MESIRFVPVHNSETKNSKHGNIERSSSRRILTHPSDRNLRTVPEGIPRNCSRDTLCITMLERAGGKFLVSPVSRIEFPAGRANRVDRNVRRARSAAITLFLSLVHHQDETREPNGISFPARGAVDFSNPPPTPSPVCKSDGWKGTINHRAPSRRFISDNRLRRRLTINGP